MKREEIVKLAPVFEHFFKLAVEQGAKEEREACAKLCDELHLEGEDNTGVAADLIRARGNNA